MSTCNRVEVLACGTSGDAVAAALPSFLAAEHGVAAEAVGDRLYTTAAPGGRHLFRVARASIRWSSAATQILGLKERTDRGAPARRAVSSTAFHKAFSARSVRSRPASRHARSPSAPPPSSSRGIFEQFRDKTALLIGAGAMGELTARALLAQGTGTLMVVNRTFERASEIAGELGGIAVPFDKLGRTLPLADLVVSAAGGDRPLLGRADVHEAMRERRGKPMFLIDLAVPRSFESTINDLDGVYLYDIDDLEGVYR